MQPLDRPSGHHVFANAKSARSCRELPMRSRSFVALLFFCSTLSFGDDTARGGHRPDDRRVPKLFDSQGKVVGPVESFRNEPGVYLSINGALTFVPVRRQSNADYSQYSASQFQWSDTGFIAYTGANCSGSPIIVYYDGPRPSMAVRQGTDVVVYVAADAWSAPTVAASIRQNPNLSECTSYSGTIPSAFVPESSYPITQFYPEPLTIRY